MNGWLEGMKDGCVDGFYTVVRRRATAVCVTRTYLSNRLSLPSSTSFFFLLPSTFSLHPSFFIFQQGETVPMVANDAGSMLPRTMLARRLGERSLGIPRGVEGRTHVATRANNG